MDNKLKYLFEGGFNSKIININYLNLVLKYAHIARHFH